MDRDQFTGPPRGMELGRDTGILEMAVSKFIEEHPSWTPRTVSEPDRPNRTALPEDCNMVCYFDSSQPHHSCPLQGHDAHRGYILPRSPGLLQRSSINEELGGLSAPNHGASSALRLQLSQGGVESVHPNSCRGQFEPVTSYLSGRTNMLVYLANPIPPKEMFFLARLRRTYLLRQRHGYSDTHTHVSLSMGEKCSIRGRLQQAAQCLEPLPQFTPFNPRVASFKSQIQAPRAPILISSTSSCTLISLALFCGTGSRYYLKLPRPATLER